ncbi:hypothetical protein B0H11DRAFT_1260271 [Mycena galericulata]|nr:hypothetical protein B0H11DRAFT_1260271 [Mycena galericulata]
MITSAFLVLPFRPPLQPAYSWVYPPMGGWWSARSAIWKRGWASARLGREGNGKRLPFSFRTHFFCWGRLAALCLQQRNSFISCLADQTTALSHFLGMNCFTRTQLGPQSYWMEEDTGGPRRAREPFFRSADDHQESSEGME